MEYVQGGELFEYITKNKKVFDSHYISRRSRK